MDIIIINETTVSPDLAATTVSILRYLLDVTTLWAIYFPFISTPSAKASGMILVTTSQNISIPAYILGFFNVTDDAEGSIIFH